MIAVLPARCCWRCSPAGSGRGCCSRVLAIPSCSATLRFYNEPKPAEPPAWYPARGWPLWFVGFAFRHMRLAGGLLTLGLLLNVLVPVRLPLPWL